MEAFVLVLIGLLSDTVHAVCPDLSIFAGTKQVYLSNSSCHQYDPNSCSKGITSLPDNLNQGRPVSEPPDFKVSEYDSKVIDNGTERYSAGINITWAAPRDDRSLMETKGYFLKMQLQGASNFSCWLFAVDLSTRSASMNFRFKVTVFPVNQFGTYRVELSALPPVDPEALTTKTTVKVKGPGRSKPDDAGAAQRELAELVEAEPSVPLTEWDLVAMPFVSVVLVLVFYHVVWRKRPGQSREETQQLAHSAA